MLVLGVESSCDETALALVNSDGKIIAQTLASQINTHSKYGGVVPEVASRAHLQNALPLFQELLTQAGLSVSSLQNHINAVASTTGPGLVGGLLMGSSVAKTLALVYNKPFIAVNHLVGHALMPLMFNKNISYPFLLLLVSGGHSQFVAVLSASKYKILGDTLDDSVGEAFDKSARLIDLPYPGGKYIEALALKGNKDAFVLPMPLIKANNCNFSLSGLKTSFSMLVKKTKDENNFNEKFKEDLSASLQHTIAKLLSAKTLKAIDFFNTEFGELKDFIISGGVSANKYINNYLLDTLNTYNLKHKTNITLSAPPLQFATDNAVMIAWAALQQLKENKNLNHPLNTPINPRLSIEDTL